MSEDEKLAQMEKKWENNFERFTTPIPTVEQTFELINKIRENIELQPIDIREELEVQQGKQSIRERITNLFLSQWNFYGSRSWLYTGLVMLFLCLTINQNAENAISGYIHWIKWGTLFVILFIAYAFRTKDEGNYIIEKLSYYSLIHQMFARFTIVMGVQFLISLPLSYFVLGNSSSILLVFTSFSTMFFFGVTGFISIFWFGHKIGSLITLMVWMIQLIFESKLNIAYLFQAPSSDTFIYMHIFTIILSFLLLSSTLTKTRMERYFL